MTYKLTQKDKLRLGELFMMKRLVKDVYPNGIVSVVMDTYDLWNVVGRKGICEALKDDIIARDGKTVIRPDSGDPVHILCGYTDNDIAAFKGQTPVEQWEQFNYSKEQKKGVVECLWDIFGGTVNDEGYKELDPHIGVIYGDSITLARQDDILKRLEAKGFAATNVVLGIGSFTYQFVTRDTFGMAYKSTYGEVNQVPYNIFKDPATDSGLKKSAKGLLAVHKDANGEYYMNQEVSWDEFKNCQFQKVWENGQWVRRHNFEEIKQRLNK